MVNVIASDNSLSTANPAPDAFGVSPLTNIAVICPPVAAQGISDGLEALRSLCGFANRQNCGYLIAPQVWMSDRRMELSGSEFDAVSLIAKENGVNLFFSYHYASGEVMKRSSCVIASSGNLAMAFASISKCDFSKDVFSRMGGGSADFMVGSHAGLMISYDDLLVKAHRAVLYVSDGYLPDSEGFTIDNELAGNAVARAIDDITGRSTADYREKGMGNPVGNALWIMRKCALK